MLTVCHTTYNLHGTHMLTLSKPRTTTYGLHSLSYFSTQQLNDLPNELRSNTFNDFKRHLQSLNKLSLISFTNFCLILCVFVFNFRHLNLFLEDISYIV